jgi:hypothetical protein
MAFPVIEGTPAETAVSTAGTSHAITLPASIASTDGVLIIVDIGSVGATFNALTGWTELLDEAVANGLKILWYTGAGVPSNPTFTSSGNCRSASIAFRISNVSRSNSPQIATTGTGTSATPDPPSVTPTGGVVRDYLFIAFFGQALEEADDDTWVNSPPTNYAPATPWQKACGTAGTNLGGLIGAASRSLNTGSAQDPGTFGVDVSAAWRSQHIIVHPLAAGAATGTVAWVGSSTGTRASSGAATGSIAWVGSATGTRTSSGSATGSIAWVGSATGQQPAAPPNDGEATGTITWAGTATGARQSAGAATGSITWAGAATGARQSAGAATGSVTWVGVATGTRQSAGAATGTVTWVGVATGTRTSQGAATGSIAWVGSATGEAPVEGVNEGSATGTITWVGVATGARRSAGAATGTVAWVGVATGSRQSAGVATGTVAWVGVAEGEQPGGAIAVFMPPRWTLRRTPGPERRIEAGPTLRSEPTIELRRYNRPTVRHEELQETRR